jgi:hypothetical protein
MNRKLHNTFLGLTASTAMLSLALALGAPADPPYAAPESLASAIEIEVQVALAEAGIEVEQARHAAAAARAAAAAFTGGADASDDGHRRRSRQSVAVPYFSFAPRG